MKIREFESFDIEASEFIFGLISKIIDSSKSKINIALSGGKTPLPVLSLLSKKNLPWGQINFFLVDERIVNIKSTESNFYNLTNTFFNYISTNSYQIISSNESIERDIFLYNYLLEQNIPHSNGIPCFDLILLGMGLDGHIASIFKNSIVNHEMKKLVVECKHPDGGLDRITMTYPVLFNAKQTVLLINGIKKKKFLFDRSREKNFPIDLILENSNNIEILCSKT